MKLQALQTALNGVLPILNDNLTAAYNEYMSGELSAGAYGYVRSRHETALTVMAGGDFTVESAYKACAPICIDLRPALKLAKNTQEAEKAVDAYWQCFRDAGYTEVHKLFNLPILPELAAA